MEKKITILIAEDMDVYISIYQAFLEKEFRLVFVKNGSEILEEFQKTKPDLVFMDILMPGENGLDALREIRLEDTDIPVIAITVMDNKKEQKMFLDHGFTDFIPKPLNKNELIQAIEKYCSASSSLPRTAE